MEDIQAPNPLFPDHIAQVLTSLRLLRQEEDQDTTQLYSKILSEQNPDGSWGKDNTDIINLQIHYSLMATDALLFSLPNLELKKTKSIAGRLIAETII